MSDFYTYLFGGVSSVQDSDPTVVPSQLPTGFNMAKHTAQFHPNGRHEGDTCKYDAMAAEEADAKGDDLEESDAGNDKTFNNGLVTPEEDAAYSQAVESGNTDAAIKLLSDVATRLKDKDVIASPDNKPVIFYHGSDGKYTSFDPKKDKNGFGDIYFTDDATYAKSFGKEIYPCFLFVKNPSVHDWNKEGFSKALTSRSEGHDAAFVTGVKDFTGIPHNEVLMRDNRNIKSADVTRNEDGSLIPLSQRFDFLNPDIRY